MLASNVVEIMEIESADFIGLVVRIRRSAVMKEIWVISSSHKKSWSPDSFTNRYYSDRKANFMMLETLIGIQICFLPSRHSAAQ